MLPDFPEVKARLLRMVSIDYRRQINADNLIGQISAMPYFEGGRFSNGDVEGHIEDSPAEMTMLPYEIERSAIVQHGILAFAISLKKLSQLHLEELHKMLYRKHTEVTARVGNQVNAGGAPFSADLYFELLEKLQVDFDDLGRPDTASTRLVMHPDMAERVIPLMEAWEADENFQQRYRDLMLRKRDEWRDRESNRKLVD
ncbi:MAG TPA: hypothetical protein VHC90_03340 [Bryobacteraceae bacterium]|nr:hypothetical protein [Bryobacteraceae bacterium]